MRETAPLMLRIDPDVKARLVADAERHRRSVTAHVEHLLDAHTPPLEDADASVAS